ADIEPNGKLGVAAFTGFVRIDNALSQFDRMRVWHTPTRSERDPEGKNPDQLRRTLGLEPRGNPEVARVQAVQRRVLADGRVQVVLIRGELLRVADHEVHAFG